MVVVVVVVAAAAAVVTANATPAGMGVVGDAETGGLAAEAGSLVATPNFESPSVRAAARTSPVAETTAAVAVAVAGSGVTRASARSGVAIRRPSAKSIEAGGGDGVKCKTSAYAKHRPMKKKKKN